MEAGYAEKEGGSLLSICNQDRLPHPNCLSSYVLIFFLLFFNHSFFGLRYAVISFIGAACCSLIANACLLGDFATW